MQTERVQESWEPLHDQKDADCQHSEEGENHKEDYSSHVTLPRQRLTHDHLPQHLWQLCRDTNESLLENHSWLENNNMSVYN